MMNASESQSGRALNESRHRVRSGVEAAFSARQMMSTAACMERKSIGAVSLNALLANELLAALPCEEFERFLPHLEPVTLKAGEDLYEFEGGIPFAYFPETAIVSHLYVLADGNTAEAAMIGQEGVAGLSAIFDVGQPCYWTRVLVTGNALRIRMDILKQEFGRGLALQRLLFAYADSRMAQLSQRAACSGLHKIEERLCCWLLMVHDRIGEDQFQLTHELIASHLGVRRAGITVAANALRDKNIIGYSRGLVLVLDRQRLEAAACECYELIGQSATRLSASR